jgi:diguanylate cyclase (GGDEF)-like protein/PAS domain S-box-containing protein
MSLQWNPVIIPLLVAGISSIVLAFQLLPQLRIPGTKVVFLILVLSAIWVLGYSVELSSKDLEVMVFGDRIQILGIIFIPTLYLIFVVQYIGRLEWLQDRNIILFSFLPILFLVLIFLNSYHGLIWGSHEVFGYNGLLYLLQSYGPGFNVFLAYSFILVLLAEGVLVYALYRSFIFYRSFIVTMMAAGLLPIAVAYFDYLGLSPLPYFQSSPLAVGVTALTVAYNLERIRKGDLTSVSRTTLFKQLSDVVIVLDDQERVLDINQRALTLFGLEQDEIMNKAIDEVWLEWKQVKYTSIINEDQPRIQFKFPDDSTYTVSTSQLSDWRDQIQGQIVLLQDVTAYRRRTDEISALLDVNNLVSGTLDLNQVLLRLAGKLLEVSKMQKCTITEWNPETGSLRYLVDHSKSYWHDPPERIQVTDIPIINRILVTGQPEILIGRSKNPGKRWFLRKGINSRILYPLLSGNEIVGFIELGSVKDDEVHDEDIDRCQVIMLKAADWLVTPLRFNEVQSLIELAKTIILDGWGSYASIYEWDKSQNTINRVVDYSEIVWLQDDGPTVTLDDWPIAERVLKTRKADVLLRSDEYFSAKDIENLDSWDVQMVVIHPISIKNEPIGIVELYATSEQIEISENELKLWQTMADQAAIAIMNAKLYEKAQEEIQERTRVEQQLRYHAYHDSLTGLSNRALLLDRLKGALNRSRRIPDYHFAALFLDVDDFKNINDSYGHPIGDKLLIAIANRLSSQVREVDTLARLGGDEFVLLVEGLTDRKHITDIAERVLFCVGEPFKLVDIELKISSSIGIVIDNNQYDNAEDILRDADIAMYRAKERGKARYVIFHPGMRESILSRLRLEADLHTAIQDRSLSLVYQPIIGISNGGLMGYETLVRWILPDGSTVDPSKFIPIAEETGLIVQLGKWIFNQTCHQMETWSKNNSQSDGLSASINISSVQIFQPDFVENIEDLLKTHNIGGEILCLEITEGTIIQDFNAVSSVIHQLKSLGVRVHLDDFGKGYSSLSYISQLPIDAIKIDKYFIATFENPDVKGIIKFIVSMSKELGIYVIAEGVENIQQHQFLEEIGCEFGQGFLYGRPLEAGDFERRYLKIETPQ